MPWQIRWSLVSETRAPGIVYMVLSLAILAQYCRVTDKHTYQANVASCSKTEQKGYYRIKIVKI